MVYIIPCQSEPQFIFFKVSLALLAGFFGWFLSGFINVNYQTTGLIVKAGGGGALFVLVLIFTPQLSAASHKCDPDPNYTIILRDSMGRTIPGLTGNLSILVGDNTETPEIQKNGAVDVKGITENKESYKFNIELLVDGWSFATNRGKVLDTFFKGRRLVLPLVMDDTYCCVKVRVINSSGHNEGLSGASVYIEGRKLTTDTVGETKYLISADERQSYIKLRVEKDSFQTVEKTVLPGSDFTTIYLSKK